LTVNGFTELFLFHEVHYQGQNLFCTESKLLGLFGGGPTADCYRIDPVTLFQDVEFQTPTWRDLKGATTPEAVNLLQVGEQNSSLFKGKLGMIVPPLVLTSILEAGTMGPAHLIPILSGMFQEFDRSSPVVKACTLLRPVLEYLWGVHKNLIHPVVFCLERNDESQEWANRLHFANIAPLVPPALPPPFQLPPPPQAPADNWSAWDLIAGDIRVIRDATECQHLREVAAEDAKKGHSSEWDKIPELVQQMILKLSATSDEVLPGSPCETYLQMLKQSKALGVAMVMNIELSIRVCQVEVPTTMANAIGQVITGLIHF